MRIKCTSWELKISKEAIISDLLKLLISIDIKNYVARCMYITVDFINTKMLMQIM